VTHIPESLRLNANRHHLMFELPTNVDDEQVLAAADEYRRLEAARVEAAGEQRKLEDARRDAVDRDEQAFADALKAGKADPGAKHTSKADEAIVQARRRAAALERAAQQALGEFLAVLEQRRVEWTASLEEQVAQARLEFGDRLAALTEAHGQLADRFATLQWLEQMPTRGLFRAGQYLAVLPHTETRSGEPFHVGQVFERLGEFATPPAAPAPIARTGHRGTRGDEEPGSSVLERAAARSGKPFDELIGMSVSALENLAG